MEKAAFFRESKYAMFIHWGLYSQAANLWEGKPFYGISEWMMFCRQIPVRDYERLAKEFNPVAFDAKRWVEIARNAGMRYIVITANHHEGVALFRSSDPLRDGGIDLHALTLRAYRESGHIRRPGWK